MKKSNIFMSLSLSLAMSPLAMGAETAEEIAQGCFYDAQRLATCCVVNHCQNKFLWSSKPQIRGFGNWGVAFNNGNCTENFTSHDYDSVEECNAVYERLPNKCILNKKSGGGYTKSLEIIRDHRAPMDETAKNRLQIEFNGYLESGDFDTAVAVVLADYPLTHDEYKKYFMDPMRKAGHPLEGPEFNRGGFLYDYSDPKMKTLAIDQLDHFVCSIKDKDNAKFENYFNESNDSDKR